VHDRHVFVLARHAVRTSEVTFFSDDTRSTVDAFRAVSFENGQVGVGETGGVLVSFPDGLPDEARLVSFARLAVYG